MSESKNYFIGMDSLRVLSDIKPDKKFSIEPLKNMAPKTIKKK